MDDAKKVLVIDDDVEFRRSTRALLENEGFRVVTAPSGEEGFALAEKTPPDLIVLDVMMEHNTAGFEISRMMRSSSTLKKIPIVLVTGICREMNLPFTFEVDEAYLPVTHVLEKPVNPADLLVTIKTALDKPFAAKAR